MLSESNASNSSGRKLGMQYTILATDAYVADQCNTRPVADVGDLLAPDCWLLAMRLIVQKKLRTIVPRSSDLSFLREDPLRFQSSTIARRLDAGTSTCYAVDRPPRVTREHQMWPLSPLPRAPIMQM